MAFPVLLQKKRLRQLGHDYVDGTIIELDKEKKQPFYFLPGTLKDNEIFVIDNEEYKRLLSTDNSFAKLINSGKFIYLGYVVCLFESKYIDFVEKSGKVEFVLSNYAREHADECCLIFSRHIVSVINEKYKFGEQAYLCKFNSGDYIDKSSLDEFCLSEKVMENIRDHIESKQLEEHDVIELAKMKIDKIENFSETLEYHINTKKIKIRDIIEVTGLSKTIIWKYRKGSQTPSLENVMLLCLACRLSKILCLDLIKKPVIIWIIKV